MLLMYSICWSVVCFQSLSMMNEEFTLSLVVHRVVPQARSSAASPVHSSPPFLAHSFTNLDRSWNPPSQVAEQRPHLDQGLQVQSTEMRNCFKCEFFVEGNLYSPEVLLFIVVADWSLASASLRISRIWLPELVGHFSFPLLSVSSGNWSEKYGDASNSRDFWPPPPHLHFHATYQATGAMVAPCFLARLPGQGNSLQYWVLVSFPTQGLPPFWACWAIVLVEVCMPPSHDLEQVSHAPQLPNLQSTGKKYNYLIWVRQQRQYLPLTF